MATNAWDGAEFDAAIYAANAAATNVQNLAAAIGQGKAQKEYNELQKELARERNALEKEEFERSLAWEKEKLASQQDYASFASQIAMAQRAGVSPYTAIGNPANGGSSGSPGRSSYQTPSQVVEDGFATGLQHMADGNIDAIRQLAASRKDNADATAQNISNVVLAERNARELESLGLGNAAQQIRNERDAALSPLQVENQDLENQHLSKMNRVLDLESDLKQFDLSFLSPAKYKNLLEQTRLLGEQIITQNEYRQHLRRLDEYGRLNAVANYMDAKTRQMVAPSQIAQNYALVKYYDAAAGKEEQMRLNYVEITALNNAAARMKKTENEIYQEYARFNAWYDNNILKNKSTMSEYDVKMSYQQYLMNQKHLNWYDANQVVNMLIPIKYGSGSQGSNIRGQKPIWEDLENRQTPVMGSDGMLNYGNGVFEDSRGWIYNAQTREWLHPSP